MHEASLVVTMCTEKNREKLDLGEGLGLTVHYDACAVTTTKAKMAVPSPS